MGRFKAVLKSLVLGGAMLAAGCLPPDDGTPQARWQQPLSDLPGGLLSISGTSPTDVYAVGADGGDGGGPVVVHYDGEGWTRLYTQTLGDLWWINDRALDDAFFMVGESGKILRYERGTGNFERFETPDDGVTLYGVWGDSASNVVAVGGDPNDPDTTGVIWRFDGTDWTAEDTSAIDTNGIPLLFKAWGRSANEIYACGARGVVLRYDGATWSQVPTPTTRTLFTIHGNASAVVAVGGIQTGTIIELTGAEFVDVTPASTAQMNGTHSPPNGESVAVGGQGAVALRRAAGWENIDTGLNLDPILSYHATWVDPAGGIWAGGGDLTTEPAVAGSLSYYGEQDLPSGLATD